MRSFLILAIFLLSSFNVSARVPSVASTASTTSTASVSSGPTNFGFPSTLYLDAFLYYGMTTGKVEGQTDDLSLNQRGIGITFGALISGVLFGVGTDYRQVNNSKEPASTVGSYKGTRWAPLVFALGYLGESFLIKFEYEPTGVFNLSQPTYQGSSISYGSGGGYRLSAMYNLIEGLMVGPQYESLRFSSRYDSQFGQSNGQALTLTHIGLVGAYVF